jgi:hypothetical protein
MTRSNFDPTKPDTERTGRGGLERYLAPEAERGSNMPGEMIDGEVEDEEQDAPEDNQMSHEALPADEAARRLEAMNSGEPAVENLPEADGPVE